MLINSIFMERMHGMGEARKISEFISFFVAFKEVLESGAGVLLAFTSSRATRSIDDSGMRVNILLIRYRILK